MKPFPLILSAPSGGGKTTIARRLLETRSDVGYSVSCTTRPARTGEENGRDYYFVSEKEFRARRQRGEFAESAEVHGKLYGTLRSEVERVLSTGRHVVMDIDVQGAAQFRAAFQDSVLVFLLPPSADALLERLRGRHTEDAGARARRMVSALAELALARDYGYVVVNDDLALATARVSAIIDAEECRRDRIGDLDERVRELSERLQREVTSFSETE